MQHKCVQVRRGGGRNKNYLFAIFFMDAILAKSMKLKNKAFCVSFFFFLQKTTSYAGN